MNAATVKDLIRSKFNKEKTLKNTQRILVVIQSILDQLKLLYDKTLLTLIMWLVSSFMIVIMRIVSLPNWAKLFYLIIAIVVIMYALGNEEKKNATKELQNRLDAMQAELEEIRLRVQE